MPIPSHECHLLTVFAVNVRKKRIQLGLSQEALAEAAGVHRTYVGMLERAEKNVTIYNIEQIAAALEMEAYELLMDSFGKKAD